MTTTRKALLAIGILALVLGGVVLRTIYDNQEAAMRSGRPVSPLSAPPQGTCGTPASGSSVHTFACRTGRWRQGGSLAGSKG